MITNFTYDFIELKRLAHHHGKAAEMADTSSNEMLAFANKLLDKINNFYNLKESMTSASTVEISDALTSIKHVKAALKELRDLYFSTDLIDYFDPALLKIAQIYEKAEEKSKLLSDMIK